MSGGTFDHNLDGITDGQGVAWDATAMELVPVTLGGGASSLPGLSDVDDTVTATKGDLLVADGAEWDDLPVGADGQVLTADAAEAFGVKWADAAAGGGVGPTGPWHQDNVAASQTDVALTLLDGVRETIPAPADGSVTAIAVLSNEARTAGTLTVELTVNGVGSGLTAVLDGTNTECDVGTGSVAVSECDEIGVTVTTDGSWAPTTADITVMLQLGAASGGGAVPGWITHLVADGTEDEGQEFDGTSGTGTKIEPSGSATATEAQGVLSVVFDSQSAVNLTGFMFPLSGTWQAGSYIEAAIRLMALGNENNTVAGITVADDGGNPLTTADSIVLGRVIAGATVEASTVRGTFTNYAAAASTTRAVDPFAQGPLLYCRLTMTSSGVWNLELSPDGVSWTDLGGMSVSGGITNVTHYGFGVSRNGTGAEPAIATTDYLRVYGLV